MASHFLILFLALVLDRIVGDPDWLWRRLPHPVVGFGAAIAALDRTYNRSTDSPAARRRNGWLAIAALLLGAIVAGAALERVLRPLGPVGALVDVVVVAVFLAQKSLAEHVERVETGLSAEGLEAGRQAVSMIVGRDPKTLDAAGVARAAIESLAENFADGVVAPALWFAIGGLPALLAYKMLNTADSMIGHKTPRHGDFGRGAALADDVANWPAARFSAGLIALAAWIGRGRQAGRRALDTALRDAGLHRSPNSGWPEAAMAGALDIALAGPRVYAGVLVNEPMMNAAGSHAAGPDTIGEALKVFAIACSLLATAALFVALACL